MKYSKLTAIVLKKQNYKEADQIATVYTREAGKIRCIAKSLRMSLSKLAGSFQDFSAVQMETTAGRGLPVLISSKTVRNFGRLKTDLAKMAAAFYAAELLIRLTPDEQANAEAYDLLAGFFAALDECGAEETLHYLLLDSFALRLLRVMGFSIEFAKEGFRLSAAQTQIIEQLETLDYQQTLQLQIPEKAVKQTHKIVGQFVEYIIERNIKSESFLNKIS
jgi:DNA repair protein RecO